jgi:hypothetical protein
MDTIYSVNSNGITPFIALQTKNLLPASLIAGYLKESPSLMSIISALENGNEIYAIRSYVENDDLIRFIFSQGRNYREIIINKNTMMPVCLKVIMNDFVFTGDDETRFPDFYCGENKKIVGKVNNLKHFQQCIRTKKTNLTEEEKNRLLNIQPADNPLLIILQTK